MEVWQRGTAFAAVASGSFTADRLKWYHSGAGVVTINRSTNVPSVAQAGVLFNYSAEVDVTTADASIAAGDYYTLKHIIEGYNWRHFAQRDCVLSFWVSSSKTGTHGVGFSNYGSDRSLVATYTVNVADTWERKTVSIPASPSAGTWDYANAFGLGIEFTLAAGSTYQTAVTTWQATGPYLTTAAQVNVLDSTANFFRITGVKLELGSVATPIQYVPFEEELARCQRYYQKSFNYEITPAQNSGIGNGEATFTAPAAGAVAVNFGIQFKTRMRVAPTRTLYNPAATNAEMRNITDSADFSATTNGMGDQSGFQFSAVSTAGTAAGERLALAWTADAEL
jgi:hypothetical protein